MKRVWIINQFAVTPDQPGGTRHFELSRELSREGFEVTIVASDFHLAMRRFTKLKGGQWSSREEVDGVHFRWLRTTTYARNNWRRAANMLGFALAVLLFGLTRSAPDVIVGSSPQLFSAFAAYLVARVRRVGFVLELRDLWPQTLIDMEGKSESSPAVRVMRFMERTLYGAADAIITLSPGSEEYLLQRGVPRDRIFLIPNGVHLGQFRITQNRDVVRKRLGVKGFTVVYAGAHGPANNLETVLDAALKLRSVPDLQFVLVGDGPSKNELVAQAKAKSLQNVIFLEPVPKKEVPDLLHAADIGILSLKDSPVFRYGVSPNKLFDYFGARLPVVTTVPGVVSEWVTQAEAGVCTAPGDSVALAEAIMKLKNMSVQELRSMGESGHAFVAQHFSRELLAQKLASILRSNG